MVFCNERLNGTGEIIVYSNYHRYWEDQAAGIRNPKFDLFSGKILDLKQGKQSAIEYFYNLIDKEINYGVTICVVPSSNPDNVHSGIAMLGEMLASNRRNNKVYYLRREQAIPKLATGGRRDKDIHLRTIGTLKEMDITGDVVLLMDDVTTTGNSLIACKEILINNGAKTVEMFALGRAVRD